MTLSAVTMTPRGLLERILSAPATLALVVALSFFWQLGAVPLYDLDEGAFTEATREMLASGNYITPHRDGEPRYDKPVLIYWLQAASAHLFGFDEFTLRLPSALAAALWVLALWGFVRRHADAATATVAGLVMALSLQVPVIARAAVADALLNLLLALTFFEIYRYAAAPDAARGARLRTWLWMGLGFLAKGPVAVFFPLVVSALFFASRWPRLGIGQIRRWLALWWAPRGWLIFLAVAAPWYLAIYLDDGSGFFRSFFLQHNLGRFAAPMQGHSGSAAYYLVALPLMLLPFSGWGLLLVTRWRSAWCDPFERFLWLWFLTVLAVFSFSGTKLPHYLLYGMTPLFVLMARYRTALRSQWLAFVPVGLLLALLLALPTLLDVAIAQGGKTHTLAMLALGRDMLDGGYTVGLLAAVAAIGALVRWRGALPWQRLVLIGIVQAVFVYGVLVPRVFATMQGPVKEAGLLAHALNRPTVVYRTSMPSFSVYRGAITQNRAPRAGDLVFLRIDKLERLAQDTPGLVREPLYQRGAVALVQLRAKS